MNNKPEAINTEESVTIPIQYELALYDAKREVRPEYNVGKFAGVIFASPWAKGLEETRTHQWETLIDGELYPASLEVRPLFGFKTPTTTTLRVFLALIDLWEQQGKRPNGVVGFSVRQLAYTIGWKWHGNDTANRIHEHLRILSGTRLTWTLSYFPNAERRKNNLPDELYSDMSLVTSVHYQRRHETLKHNRFNVIQSVELNSQLVANMISGHVRPLNHHSFRSISNETSANLFARIDVYLSNYPKWERRSYDLIYNELHLTGTRYEQAIHRKALLKKFVEHLDGKELINGKLTLYIERTQDGKDWKLVARKVPRIKPKERQWIDPILSQEEAEIVGGDIHEQLMRLPKPGTPHLVYCVFLARFIPVKILMESLSLVRGDYDAHNTRKNQSALFYDIARENALKTGYKLPERKKDD